MTWRLLLSTVIVTASKALILWRGYSSKTRYFETMKALQYILVKQSHSVAFPIVSDLQILCWKYSVEWCFGKMCIFHHILQQVELGRLWQNWQVVPPTMDPSPPQTAISLQKKGLKGRHTEAITDNGAVIFFQAFLFPLLLFVWFQYLHSPICLRCLLSIPRCLWCPSVCGA